MAEIVEVTCPVCGFRWPEDLDWHRETESIHTVYPGPRPRAGSETFHFRCPQDGTWVPVTARAGAAGMDADPG